MNKAASCPVGEWSGGQLSFLNESWQTCLTVEFDHYQQQTRETAIYPENQALNYLALGLNGEAGEVAEKIKKHIRDGRDIDEDFVHELGDVLWYLARLIDELDADFSDVAEGNLDKLLDRQSRDKLKGEGDKR